ncbi:MAG TPA: HlyD family efflux transporter periplasmic adaptor subunit [Tepidisphaeraceae bacterium]|jgi:RND family efflux transporter MFP subunit
MSVAIDLSNSVAVRSRRSPAWLALPALILLAAVGGWIWKHQHFAADPVVGTFYNVVRMPMDVKVTKDGELQAVNNIDVVCLVEGQTTIQTIVKEGASVKKGDVLITLDASQIQQKLDDTTLDYQKAEADLINAREMKALQESWNAAALEAAQVADNLAKIAKLQYEEGLYPQQVADANTTLEMAEITLKNRQEDLDQTNKLFSKGFVTAADVKKSELDVTTARQALSKAKTALLVLTKYQHEMDLAKVKNDLAQADAKLMRVTRENAANLSQKTADLKAKEQALELLKRRLEHANEQLADCTIKAPADGLVVYSSSSDRNAQNPIQEGATVRERQLLLRLPDTSSMKAVLRIPEAQVSKLEIGQRATVRIVGQSEPVGATLSKISVMADNSQRWWNPDLKEYPVDLALDTTPAGLKPGVGAQAEVFVDRLEDVVAVPLAAIYSSGSRTFIFKRDGETVHPVEVKISHSNETHAELANGLAAGDEVLLLAAGQGRELLDRAGIKVEPTTKPSDKKASRHAPLAAAQR